MFRLFLKKKLFEGSGESLRNESVTRSRNRRVFQRYAIDHKHLTLMNEQDILLIRELSTKGFSTEVSERGFERLTIGDVYDARIRYLGEIYDLQARVAWKHDRYVGFEIVEADRQTLGFVRRLIKPVEIASSLKQVEAAFLQDPESGKEWLHGDGESDLFIWRAECGERVRAWQLAVGKSYVEWTDGNGLSTGNLAPLDCQDGVLGASPNDVSHNRDLVLDLGKRQLAVDVIMAVDHPLRDQLLDTLSG